MEMHTSKSIHPSIHPLLPIICPEMSFMSSRVSLSAHFPFMCLSYFLGNAVNYH